MNPEIIFRFVNRAVLPGREVRDSHRHSIRPDFNVLRSVFSIIEELKRRSPSLYFTGIFFAILSFLYLLAIPLDERRILGINPWIKPLKFTLSAWSFVWAMAWFLEYLAISKAKKLFLSYSFISVMLVEILLIGFQSLRGVRSHFNENTLFDGIIFGIMGMAIMYSTFVTIGMNYLFMRKKYLSDIVIQERIYLWSLRIGIMIFILGSLEGGMMVSHGSHTVGIEDGLNGIPFLNWSTIAGDLRISHFAGIHALQIIPLIGYLFSRMQKSRSLLPLLVFSFMYSIIVFAVLFQAILGMPLIR